MKLLLTAAVIALASFGAARAADPSLPTTGSEQGIAVPHALPGGPTHKHNSATEAHLTAPAGQVPQASERGVNPPNSMPRNPARSPGAQGHADVQSPRGVVPEVGSAQGAKR